MCSSAEEELKAIDPNPKSSTKFVEGQNYHSFYECFGASNAIKGKLLSMLLSAVKPGDTHALGASKCIELQGIDDIKGDDLSFASTGKSLTVLNVAQATQDEMWAILSGLLLLGNLTFKDDDADHGKIENQDILKGAETQLGIAALTDNLTSRVMQRGNAGRRGSSYKVEFSAKQCRAARDSIVKTIYNHIFDYVVEKVNAHIGGPEGTSELPYVGLLDIFGFENFKFNSFEQLCINFCNEKLQQFFLTYVFKAEEEMHIKEGVPKEIEFAENQPAIELLEKPPQGMLRLYNLPTYHLLTYEQSSIATYSLPTCCVYLLRPLRSTHQASYP